MSAFTTPSRLVWSSYFTPPRAAVFATAVPIPVVASTLRVNPAGSGGCHATIHSAVNSAAIRRRSRALYVYSLFQAQAEPLAEPLYHVDPMVPVECALASAR